MALSSRPVSWVNTAIPFALAYYVVAEELTPALLVGCIFFLIPYNFLMYGINDVFDYESDLRIPKRGCGGCPIAPASAPHYLWGSALLAAPFVVTLAVLGSWSANLVLAITVFLWWPIPQRGCGSKKSRSLTLSARPFIL